MRKEIGKGQDTLLWFDPWLKEGRLVELLNSDIPFTTRIRTWKVCNHTQNSTWTLSIPALSPVWQFIEVISISAQLDIWNWTTSNKVILLLLQPGTLSGLQVLSLSFRMLYGPLLKPKDVNVFAQGSAGKIVYKVKVSKIWDYTYWHVFYATQGLKSGITCSLNVHSHPTSEVSANSISKWIQHHMVSYHMRLNWSRKLSRRGTELMAHLARKK